MLRIQGQIYQFKKLLGKDYQFLQSAVFYYQMSGWLWQMFFIEAFMVIISIYLKQNHIFKLLLAQFLTY